MLNRNLKWAICLFIGVTLLTVMFSIADELPPVSIIASHGGTYLITNYAASHAAWNDHEIRLLTANQRLNLLKHERDFIDAAISKNRAEMRRLKSVLILVAGKRLGLGAAVLAATDLLDNGDMYELGLMRISKYASIRSQNSAIAAAASDRDTFHTEFVKRWHHEQTHISSQSGTPPGKTNPVNSESIPMLGADCKNACGTFYYDSLHTDYYSGFPNGISTSLGWIPGRARSHHQTSCTGTASCGDWYWTCDGIESGGTARHLLRTCKIQGRQWNSGTSSYDTVTCNMEYRNCDNPGGRCFNGSSAGNHPHNDDVTTQNSYPIIGPEPPPPPPPPSPTYHACGEHETSVSGDHSLQASCSSTDSNGNYCTVTNFYACQSHTHSYPAPPPPPPTVSCARSECGEQVSDRLKHRVDNCSNCNAVYWTCYPNAIYDHETTFTCRRSGCGQSFTRCSNTPTSCQSANYHWAQD